MKHVTAIHIDDPHTSRFVREQNPQELQRVVALGGDCVVEWRAAVRTLRRRAGAVEQQALRDLHVAEAAGVVQQGLAESVNVSVDVDLELHHFVAVQAAADRRNRPLNRTAD